ncbi:ArsR family transcriptional regulator [Pseudohoeflea suaedae]|uniref:ArsR family transcriptional regulator n=1 Tax=Pseudohoeflea suaedae TaxID=877384 RepID=A0A4R5PPK9_9HYPH|nr:metalloregulator ArsR/SmtB family transcription factor [Pseudohoeflea suaedae]TDH38939.1 ArsR family transcriptional regulator [Pseudohoeflea suaedae]
MDKTITAFAALSQKTRVDVLRLLVQRGERGMLAGEVSDHLNVKQNTMSTNLGILSRAGLIRSERSGREIRYFADYSGIRHVVGFLMEDCCGGSPELCEPVFDEVIREPVLDQALHEAC